MAIRSDSSGPTAVVKTPSFLLANCQSIRPRGDRVTFLTEPDPMKPSRSRAAQVQVRPRPARLERQMWSWVDTMAADRRSSPKRRSRWLGPPLHHRGGLFFIATRGKQLRPIWNEAATLGIISPSIVGYGWDNMKKVSEYLRHARECREMQRTFNPGSRQQLKEMAKAWEQMAEARRQQLRKQGDWLDD